MFVAYGRVSQRDRNPALQIEALNSAGCNRLFIEKATGAQRDRPELKAALGYIQAGDTLVVWKLDRLARSIRQLVETVQDLQNRQIALKVLAPGIDIDVISGPFIFHIFEAVAEFERDLRLERTYAGLATTRALGRRGGRKPAMGEAEIRRAKAMLADPALTVGDVARRMNVQPSTLYRHIPGGRSALAIEASA